MSDLKERKGWTIAQFVGDRTPDKTEMGHALGMGHNSATNSCMHHVILNNASAITPDSDDFTLIAALYNDGTAPVWGLRAVPEAPDGPACGMPAAGVRNRPR